MPSFDVVKMEDRKRPAIDDHNSSGPPSKRQNVAVNGTSAHPDENMPWKEDIEEYQKDAILREMRAYKREAQGLESQIGSLKEASAHHDDHLRTIDAWFSQLLDEISLLAVAPSDKSSMSDHENMDSQAETTKSHTDHLIFPSSLFTADSKAFEAHLQHKSQHIKDAITKLYTPLPSASPEVAELQARLSKLLVAEKDSTIELQRLHTEKDQISERLENASFRYMVAEKKMDRLRSSQVAKVEAQAIGGPKPDVNKADGLSRGDSQMGDGVAEVSNEDLAAAELARKEAVAASEARAEQLERMSQENAKLSEDLTAAYVRLKSPNDQEYANTELFKTLKSQHEDVIKRINDLEALNIQLRSEAKQLQAERTSYKENVDSEARDAQIETDRQAAHNESDLTRIRKQRDDMNAELYQIKEVGTKQRDSYEQMQQLCKAREERISVLESEVGRLRQEQPSKTDAAEELAELDPAALKSKVQALQNEKSMLANEVHSMETAYRKAHASANKKISEGIDAEERISRLSQEKAKADQKYFSTMKVKEMREAEVQKLRSQNSQTSQIVSQLKDAESSCRSLISQQEKQIAELNQSSGNLTVQQRSSQAKVAEQKALLERYESHLNELKMLLGDKDKVATSAKDALRKTETDFAQLKAKLDTTEKSAQSWRKKCESNQSEETETMRMMLICNVCRKNFKNTLLKNCGHVFCEECITQRWQNRARKCPNCNRAFGGNDYQRITL
ncbi:MAG: E3 ubiquitin-protein ligase bre1 [Chrysothrix sp. TS-e1954]|nr:MAG: E3 ubiquitin-protein ligase bre1 [Chrysothrix sp. TS-e1954]